MGLRNLAERAHDQTLKRALLNAFALLTDQEIYQVCENLAGAAPDTAAATIIDLLGPEGDRVAVMLPGIWAPGVLADSAIAAQVLTASASFKGKRGPSKDELKKAIDSVGLSPIETEAAHIDIEKVGVSALEWGGAGIILSNILISLLSKGIPAMRFATKIPRLIRAVGALGAAGYGAASSAVEQQSRPPLPLPPRGND
jgi:hypothetical protein